MNVVRELITVLGFSVNPQGRQEYERQIAGIPQNIKPAIDKLRNMFAGVFAGIGVVAGFRNIVDAGDQMTTAMNRVREAATMPTESFEALYDSARETGVAMTETTKSFMRFAPAMRRGGFVDADTITMLDGLQKGLLAAGSSAAETGSVLVQLGQAINSNNFAGDELKSFMENASPAIIERFAEALGVGVDQIKKMGSEGKLTNATVIPALIASAKAGRDAFGRMVVTVELAMARSRVAWVRFAAELNSTLGINDRIVKGFEKIGYALEWLRTHLPMVVVFVNAHIDLERAAMAAGAALMVAFGPALLRALTTAAAAMLRFSLPIAMIAGLFLIFEDLIAFLRGADSLLGDIFGKLNEQQIKMFADGFKQAVDNLRMMRDFLRDIAGYIATIAASGLTYLFRPQPGMTRPGEEGQTATQSEPLINRFFRWYGGGNTQPVQPSLNSIAPSSSVLSNNPTINQEINITAPGSDGASLGNTVGTAARNAGESAMRFGNDLARDLLRGSPATEAGAR